MVSGAKELKELNGVKDLLVVQQSKWLVGGVLDYIDISIDSVEVSDDKYPKKKRLKKVFENAIYDKQTILLSLSVPLVLKRLDDVYGLLYGELQKLIILALTDQDQRAQFMELVLQNINSVKVQIRKEFDGKLN